MEVCNDMGALNTTGQVSDSSVVIFNKVPFVEISYPIPYILQDIEKKQTRKTISDKIQPGLNFYEEVRNVYVKSNVTEKMLDTEYEELINLLKGGVIYIGSSS